jgi:hypothetical protein
VGAGEVGTGPGVADAEWLGVGLAVAGVPGGVAVGLGRGEGLRVGGGGGRVGRGLGLGLGFAVQVCVTRFDVTVWLPKACANSTSDPAAELVNVTLAVPSVAVVAVRGQPVLGPELCSKLTHTPARGAGVPLPGGPVTVAVSVCGVPTVAVVPDGARVTDPTVARDEVHAASAGAARAVCSNTNATGSDRRRMPRRWGERQVPSRHRRSMRHPARWGRWCPR